MKLDIVRAWKDENYRQNLSDTQRELLPANPVGELSEAEMEQVYGGGGGLPPATVAPTVYHHVAAPGHVFVHHTVAVTSAAAASVSRAHSLSVLCDVAVFSVNLLTIPIIPIASPLSQCCANSD